MTLFKNAWFLPQTITRISGVCFSCLYVQWKHQQVLESTLPKNLTGKANSQIMTTSMI